jgi:hypothetical protein
MEGKEGRRAGRVVVRGARLVERFDEANGRHGFASPYAEFEQESGIISSKAAKI